MFHLPLLSHRSSGDLVLGRLSKLPIPSRVWVPVSSRAAYVYIIGMSGKGKSKLVSSFSCK
jgi:hypothetical protein